jgi:hypothetical protein
MQEPQRLLTIRKRTLVLKVLRDDEAGFRLKPRAHRDFQALPWRDFEMVGPCKRLATDILTPNFDSSEFLSSIAMRESKPIVSSG